MRYLPLFIIIACVASNIHCMDAEQKALTLRRQFATTSWLQNAEPQTVKLIGANELNPSQTHSTQFVQAFLTVLDAPCFEFPSPACTIPVVCLDLKKFVPLYEAMKQLQQTEKEKEEQLKREEKERETDKLIAQLIQKHKEAYDAYDKLHWAMTFFTGDNEYWNSDLPKQNELRLERLKQEAERARAELEKRDPTNKRYDQNFLRKWELAVKA